MKREKIDEILKSKEDKEGIIKKLDLKEKSEEIIEELHQYNLESLEEINLENNGLSDLDIFRMSKSKWKNLRILNLSENRVSDTGCTELSSLEKLR